MLAVVLLDDDGRDDSRELARRARHADGEEGGICAVPNSFSEGGGARRRPNVDQSPRRSMKPRCPVAALLEEELPDWLAFGESAAGAKSNSPGSIGPNIGVGGLLELWGPRRMGGERPRLIVDASAASSFVRRSRSRYIIRVAGAGLCTGSRRSSCSSCVTVVTVVVVVGADVGGTNWAEVWLTARVRRRDKMDGIALLPIAPSCLCRLDSPELIFAAVMRTYR